MTPLVIVFALMLFLATQAGPRLWPSALRLAAIFIPAGVITAYFIAPFLLYKGYMNVTPNLQRFKYDSYGAAQILGWLINGDLFDKSRLPAMTLLLTLGVAWAAVRRNAPARLALLMFGTWLILYFGRPTLGPLLDIFPMHDGLLFHRFIAGVDLGAILLAGLGAEWLWRQCQQLTPRWGSLIAVAIILALMIPALRERQQFYATNRQWMSDTQAALQADTDSNEIVAAIKSLPPGRVYAGMNKDWGRLMHWGDVRFYDRLTYELIPALSPPWQSYSLNSDLLWYFDENHPHDYKLFNVRYVIAPTGQAPKPFFLPIKKTTRYTLYQIDSGGYVQFGQITDHKDTDSQADLLQENRAWMTSSAPAANQFIRWSYMGNASSSGTDPADKAATVINEKISPGRIEVVTRSSNDATLIFKVTYHPNWHVEVDGKEVRAFMVSPSYIGARVPGGIHVVAAEYRSNRMRNYLLLMSAITIVLVLLFGKKLEGLVEESLARS